MSAAVGAPARRIGIDVGGTKALGVALSPDDEVIAEVRHRTPRGVASLDALFDTLVEIVGELGPHAPVTVGVPGLVTPEGVLRAAPNLDGVADLDVSGTLSRRLGRPVAVDNDANCAARAEMHSGAGRGVSELVMVTLGTGIGGALVSDGVIRRGAHGFAGEAGHMTVDPGGPPCPCGRSGCWEVYASGNGLTRLTRDAAAAGRLDTMTGGGGRVPSALEGEDVLAAAAAGDPGATAVIDEFARWVAIGLAGLANVLDPEVFVLGGGLSSHGDRLGPPIRAHLRDQLYQSELRTVPRVEFAQLGERAGAVGAALLAST